MGVIICFSFSTITDVHYLADKYKVKVAKASYDLLSADQPEGLKTIVYPNSYANALIKMSKGYAFCPMRYRLRPFNSENEIPSKYNLYNARLEGILEKKVWAPLIARKHVAIPVTRFHEWVPTDKGKKIAQFYMPENEIFWIAGLYDIWKGSKPGEQIVSFALITQPPNDYIREVGHDRCPLIITESEARNWVATVSPDDAMHLLKKRREYHFSHQWSDPVS